MQFVSPNFFAVVPTLEMTKVAIAIGRNYFDKRLLKEFESKNHSILPKVSDFTEKAKGAYVAELYFRQIFSPQCSCLDLRSASFDDQFHWNPQPLFWEFSHSFQTSLQRIYRGFYTDNHLEYSQGLKELDLEHAKDIFTKHFGGDRQEHVVFRLEDFKNTFQEIFASCLAHKKPLHREFVPFGIYLMCLYQHLSKLNTSIDVRGSFRKAVA